jgi:phosphonate transport system ATP-binding protein
LPLLELQHVSKTYDNVTRALQDVSLTVDEGEFVSVIGPSGAGKSTLLRCINRLVDATQGVIMFDGQDITHVKGAQLRRVRTRAGMIFQHYNLVNRLSVVENVLHGRLGYKSTLSGSIGLYSEREKEQAFLILDKLGLTEQAYKRCDELSGGQKQRVGIARALMQEPRLILCDEPIASLDPNASKVIMDYLRDINETMNITCLVNLHQVDVAMRYSRRIVGITAGRVVYDGPTELLDKNTIHWIYQSAEGGLITDVRRERL